jgi:hypothetical protein
MGEMGFGGFFQKGRGEVRGRRGDREGRVRESKWIRRGCGICYVAGLRGVRFLSWFAVV